MTALSRCKAQLEKRMLSAVTQAAAQAAAHARSIAPVGDGKDGGHLRDCISSRVQAGGGVVQGEVAADNPHALYVEMGTSRMAAQPYLRPALQMQKARFVQALKRIF